MKLSVYAKQVGVSYRTAFRWFKSGKIEGRQMDTGTILISEPIERPKVDVRPTKVAIYTRVSVAENKDNLEAQAQRLQDYCAAKGYQVAQVVKEIGSGVNDTRPKLMKLLGDPTVTLIVVEHKDRLTRFGFNYIEQLLQLQDRQVEVINLAEKWERRSGARLCKHHYLVLRPVVRSTAFSAENGTAHRGIAGRDRTW